MFQLYKQVKKNSIKDVANRAGVSIATVSYVLNGRHEDRISDETKKRVRKAVKELAYRPNKIAQSLKTNRSKILGFIVADITNPFFSELAQLVENDAMKMGFTVLIGSADENAKKFDVLVQLFQQQQIEGLILAPVEGCEKTITQLEHIGLPFVLVDRYIPGKKTNSVRINNHSISEAIAQHFHNRAKHYPLVVSYETELKHLVERRDGFVDCFDGKIAEVKVSKDYIAQDIWNGLDKYWKNKTKQPDCIYFTSNKLAFEGLKFLLYKRKEFIQDLEIVAFDKSMAYELYPGNIYYVQQPLEEITKHTLALLQRKIDENSEKYEEVQLDAKLVLDKVDIF